MYRLRSISALTTLICLSILVLWIPTAMAVDYAVTVSRDAQNYYVGKYAWQGVIKTQFCYEYVYYDDATLSLTTSSTGTLIFSSGQQCSVENVFDPANYPAGSYTAYVDSDGDGYYEVTDGSFLFKALGVDIAYGSLAEIEITSAINGIAFGTIKVGNSFARSLTNMYVSWDVNVSPTNYSLSVSKAGSGSGTVTSNPAGINCGSTCSADYTSGTSVTLTANPASGSTFGGWSGPCSGTGTCTVSMTQARSVTATFNATATNYTLSVSRTGSGSGTVTSNPAGINCGSTCSANYTSGTSVTLTASSASGSTFGGWSGSCSGTGTCTVSMAQARSVTASFNAAATNYNLSVSKTGVGNGTVTSNPAGINCGSTCSAGYTSGTSVTLTANPASGSTFGGWSGSCSGTGTCTVSMTQARSVTASFTGPNTTDNAAAFSGLWYNPAQDGHGFSISVHSATSASVYWYTFDPFGFPLWIYGAGDIVGNRIESSGFVLYGMEFGSWDPLAKEVFDWGSFEIDFHSCDSATLTYDSTVGYESGEEFGSGTFPLVRLAPIDGLDCP
jgi:uncharacterized protein (DUF2141 family)